MKNRIVRPSDPTPTYALHCRGKLKRAVRIEQKRRHKGR